MSATTEFLALQAVVAGRFSLVSEVGRGGMGIVFLAHDVLLERPVAIKMLSPALSARPEMRRRFLREARIAAQCFHPHIVPIHAVEEAGDVAFFVMAYVRGETLAERLHRVGALNAEQVRRIGREVGWALAYAHDRGVIHRDVKPENILLEDGSDRALIADFGIALHDDPSRTPASGEVAGTARFMAPEQALGEPIDGRADLYALGVTLYVAATARYPFHAASGLALVAQQSLQGAQPVRVDAPNLPESLANAVDRCLAIRPDDRFASAAAFVDALAAAPAERTLLPSLAAVRDSANAALLLWGWSQVFNVTTGLLRWGEPSAFGDAIVGTLGVGITILTFAAAVVRGVESALAARQALREGVPGSDVALALGGAVNTIDRAVPTREQRAMGGVMVGIGAALGYAQGALTANYIPDPLSGVVQVALLVLPPLLIGKGASLVLRQSPITSWLRRKVRQPLANALTRMLGGDTRPSARRPALESTRTEIVLAQAADELFARLPAVSREALGELPAAAAALAREAELLRTREGRLARDDREARLLPASERERALERIESERVAVRARLATAIAALEAIRMDLIRLDTGDTASGLTAQLDIVRDLQRRVDAEADVRALLAKPTMERTPA